VTGQAGPSQVPGAKTALVSAQAGLGIQSSIIYRRNRTFEGLSFINQ